MASSLGTTTTLYIDPSFSFTTGTLNLSHINITFSPGHGPNFGCNKLSTVGQIVQKYTFNYITVNHTYSLPTTNNIIGEWCGIGNNTNGNVTISNHSSPPSNYTIGKDEGVTFVYDGTGWYVGG